MRQLERKFHSDDFWHMDSIVPVAMVMAIILVRDQE